MCGMTFIDLEAIAMRIEHRRFKSAGRKKKRQT